MSGAEKREEILDLLARGKISIDEAVEMLDPSKQESGSQEGDEPLYKAEMAEGFDAEEVIRIKLDDDLEIEELPVEGKGVHTSEPTQSKINGDGNGIRPRWLRVQVVNTETGKNKVSINVPFGVVKFGLGIARVFSPEMEGVDFDEIGELLSNADAGLLVDVQDEESNEHVKIFFD